MAKRPYMEHYGLDVEEEERASDCLERVLEPYSDQTKIKLLRSYAGYLSQKVKALQLLREADEPTVPLESEHD